MTSDARSYSKPLPVLDDSNRPFWASARNHQLTMQQCTDCSHIRYPLNQVCPVCLSAGFNWKALSGRGEVLSTIVFHQLYNQAFATEIPYNVSLIQLEEGPRLISNVVGTEPSAVRVGDLVEVVFDDVTEDISIPRFKRQLL